MGRKRYQPAQILGSLQDISDQKEAENLATRFGRIVDKSFNEILQRERAQ